jgi:hypothetical protein
VGDVLAGEQAQEVRLPGAVGAEHGDPLAVEDLQVERAHEAGQLQLPAGDGAGAGAASPQSHPDVLLAGRLWRRAGLLELPQPGLGGGVAGGHLVAAGGVLLHVQDEAPELGVFLVPAAAQFLEPFEPLLACLVERGEAAAVDPYVGAARGSTLTMVEAA